MEAGDRMAINLALKPFKTEMGQPNFPALFGSTTRLPEMAKENLSRSAAIVAVGITNAMDSLNLKRPMTSGQILDLTDTVLETSAEDNLSLEDLMIFLQRLTRGEYGPMYESMDIPKFMEFFERYREERHKAMMNIRDEQSASHSADKSELRTSEEQDMNERMKHLAAAISYKNKLLKKNK